MAPELFGASGPAAAGFSMVCSAYRGGPDIAVVRRSCVALRGQPSSVKVGARISGISDAKMGASHRPRVPTSNRIASPNAFGFQCRRKCSRLNQSGEKPASRAGTSLPAADSPATPATLTNRIQKARLKQRRQGGGSHSRFIRRGPLPGRRTFGESPLSVDVIGGQRWPSASFWFCSALRATPCRVTGSAPVRVSAGRERRDIGLSLEAAVGAGEGGYELAGCGDRQTRGTALDRLSPRHGRTPFATGGDLRMRRSGRAE